MTEPLRMTGPLPVDMIELSGKTAGAAKPAEVNFGEVFKKAVDKVDEFQRTSRTNADRFLEGEDVEIHDLVMAGQRAELAFDLMLQVRNKVVQAYQEVMRMQI